MKKIINHILLISIVFSFTGKIWAQSETRDRRAALLSALTLVEEYERKSKITNSKSADTFVKMFVDKKTPIFNDLMGLSEEKKLSVEQYAKLQSESVKLPSITIKNVKKKSVNFDGQKWYVDCTFDKEVSYYDKFGIRLSSNLLYKKDYKMTIKIVYDPASGLSKIETVEGELDARPISTSYKALQASDVRDNLLRYDGELVSFNSFEQMFFPYGLNFKKLEYKDADVTAVVQEDNAHMFHMKYKARRWRISPYFNATIGDYYSITTTDGSINTKTSGSEMGIDVGYTIPSQSKLKFSVNMGIGYASSNVKLSTEGYNFSYTAPGSADVDGDSYQRHYEFNGASEEFRSTFFTIPLYLDVEYNFSRVVSAYVQLGIKNYMKISAELSDYSASNYVYGIYSDPRYGNLRLDEHWGYNNFGHHSYTKDDVTDPTISVNSFSMDFFGGLGLRIKPFRKLPLALDLGMQYQSTLLDMWNKDSNGINLTNPTEQTSLFSYKVVNAPNSTKGETVRMLNNGISKISRSHLAIKVGLVYKF